MLSGKQWTGILFLTAAGAAINCNPQSPPARSANTKVGEVYPNYVFPSLEDGRPTALSEFRGKKVILHHFASW